MKTKRYSRKQITCDLFCFADTVSATPGEVSYNRIVRTIKCMDILDNLSDLSEGKKNQQRRDKYELALLLLTDDMSLSSLQEAYARSLT